MGLGEAYPQRFCIRVPCAFNRGGAGVRIANVKYGAVDSDLSTVCIWPGTGQCSGGEGAAIYSIHMIRGRPATKEQQGLYLSDPRR
jgi:hypothetical protein